jgi:hypothetical protein
MHEREGMARRIHNRIAECRAAGTSYGTCSSSKSSSPGPARPSRGSSFFWVPQVIAFVYY